MSATETAAPFKATPGYQTWLLIMLVDPLLDPLRREPAFSQLLASLHLA